MNNDGSVVGECLPGEGISVQGARHLAKNVMGIALVRCHCVMVAFLLVYECDVRIRPVQKLSCGDASDQ